MTTTGRATVDPSSGELGFTDALVRLAHLVDRVFVDVSREHELTPQQAQLLCILIAGPVGMSELGRLLHLEKSSLTGLVDRIERRGLVARHRDDRDRRACQVALTPDGVRLGRRTHADVQARLEEVAADVDPLDRGRLVVVARSLMDAERGLAVQPER